MLTLKQILESDSISSLVAKVNLNFQQIAVSGGGPQGIPGEQGIPGLPGRQGPIGPTGLKGPTGSVVGLIPFGSQTGGSTGPTGIAGPWNTYSYEYLNTYAGTGTSVVGNIWIDHWNDGYWQYLDQSNADIFLTESPYSHVAVGPNPPDGTGYYSTQGWYFYPSKSKGGGGGVGDVWINDITTYQQSPNPYEEGPYNATSPLTVKNARLLSKYGTVWISSGNALDINGNADESNLTTPTIYDWDNPLASPASGYSNPSRYIAGVDRLYFKQSIDTLPYLSNVTARSYINASGGSGDPALIDYLHPIQPPNVLIGAPYWVKPLYSTSLDNYSPLQFYTERRADSVNYPGGTVYGSLGLFSYSSQLPGNDVNTYNYRKSLWVYSTRTSTNPDENTGGDLLTAADTFNIGEMLFDVRKLTASNQFICSLPQDMYLSSDYKTPGGVFTNLLNTRAYTVTQGYISSINGKKLTGDEPNAINEFNYGDLTTNDGNATRSSWYGSAAMFSPKDWEFFDSGNTGNTGTADSHEIDKTYRFAGMQERAKKSYNSGETYFLNELIFYTSQFQLGAGNATASSANVNLKTNAHKSLGGLYLSPFRNIGVGTFPSTEAGVFEPISRLHIHTFIRGEENDGGNIKVDVINRNFQSQYVSKYTPTPWAAYPANMYKGGALTLEDSTSAYLDFYLGHLTPPTNESANSLLSNNTPNTRSNANLDTVIRRETWSNNVAYEAAIMRLGVSPVKHDLAGNFQIGDDAARARNDFQVAISPLNPMAGYNAWDSGSPVGVGIQNLYPRARFHLYGKNLQNEGLLGNEPASPGYAVAAGTTAVDGYYPWSNYSGSQVIIDRIEQSWTYNPGFREYPYEAYGVIGLTGVAANASTPATGTSGSPNAANFPVWERSHPTRNVLPWSPLTRNYAAFANPGGTGSAQGQGIVYMHGEQYQNLFGAKSYMGFNLFRDLLNVGDDANNTRWRLGTEGDNGGSAIITSTAGDMVFVNIKTGRDGGLQYRPFEQQGLSTRDVLNNVSLVLTAQGDMGIGAQPGFDYNAFTSLERFPYDGKLNYVATSPVDARSTYPTQAGTMGTGPGTNKPYGLINYSGLSAGYPETMSVSSAAAINANANQAEYIRFDVAAQKFYGKPSRSSLETGAGYPPLTDLIIVGNDVRNYLLIDWNAYTTAGGICDRLIIATDFEGRIWYVTIQNQSGSAPFVDPRNYGYKGFVMPHPTEFNVGGPLYYCVNTYSPPFVAPSGAAAGIINYTYWEINASITGSWGLTNKSFENAPIGKANMRLNNFVAGEGMNPATEQQWVRDDLKKARQQSPKLIFTFLEKDNTTIPGSKSTNTSETIGTNRPISGTDAYRKVNTVIASAQNESSLREYWIPKSDNTGGTFMVWTDHYGRKEHELGFDVSTVASSRFYVEEVIALEFVPSYTGITGGNEYITGGGQTASVDTNIIGKTDKDYPLHVKYYNSLMGVPKYGITGATNNAFLPNQYGRKVNLFGQPLNTGPISQFTYNEQTVGSGNITGVNTQVKIGTFAYGTAQNYEIIKANSFTVTGNKPVRVIAQADQQCQNDTDGTTVQLFRGGTPIGDKHVIDAWFEYSPLAFTIEVIDYPPAGSHVYSLRQISRGGYTNPNLRTCYGVTSSPPSGYPGLPWVPSPGTTSSLTSVPVITLEEISSGSVAVGGGAIIGATGNISGTGATGLALLRNVDKYYSLVSNNTNWDNGWNSGTGPDGFTNSSSQFRFKRINSDMALVDFNMTIRVDNPDLGNGYPNQATGFTNLIDTGSPRWTQYIRLAYLPTLNSGSNDNNYFMKEFGNALSFMNWSSFNQWYPGTAVSSDLNLDPNNGNLNIQPGDSLSKTGGPNYTMNTSYDSAHTQNLVWSGNFYDATMSSNLAGNAGDYTKGQILGNPGDAASIYPQSGITPFFGNSFYNAGISKMLIWNDPNVTYDGDKANMFGRFMGKAYSILGNDYLSRVRNCTWRIVPRIGTAYGDNVDLTGATNVKNNSFTLEFMFDKPILHIDTPFAKYNFSSTTDTAACFPYQFLTVSGQAMVRYSDATNTSFAGPTTVLSGTVQGGSTGPAPGPGLAIGDPYQGGIIGYIYGPGDPQYIPGQVGGLVIATNVLPGQVWGPIGVLTGANLNNLGGGILNTGQMEIAAPNQTCAKPCIDYVSGGYTDWYLPNETELSLICSSASVGQLTTLPSGDYWTSTEVTGNLAYHLQWPGNSSIQSNKNSNKFVIPIHFF